VPEDQNLAEEDKSRTANYEKRIHKSDYRQRLRRTFQYLSPEDPLPLDVAEKQLHPDSDRPVQQVHYHHRPA
jgi:hypothetical protein